MSARRRRLQHEEPENHERWLVSYADFITLLFAFFTVMYATSQQDAAKEKEFEKSIRKSFAIFGAGGTGGASGAQGGEDSGLPRATLAGQSAGAGLEAFPGRKAGPAEVQDYVVRRLRKNLSGAEAEEAARAIRHDAVGVRIQLAAASLFPEGSADLKPEAIGELAKFGPLLKDSKRRLIIEGHTDDQPIHTARFPTNWELSALRATKIVRYLHLRQGIDEGRMTAVAYADQRPAAPNDSEENRAKNRRIEIQIVTDGELHP